MAHFHVKKKKGRPYLYVREIARVNGKPKVISQVYVGSPERVAAMVQGGAEQKAVVLKVQEFGSLWLAQQLDWDVDLASIIDGVVASGSRETGPSIGEYFLYCVWNRMIDAASKRKLPDWYEGTAVQHIRPVDTSQLNSQRYWEKWDRVSQEDLRIVAERFFKKIWKLNDVSADCLLFDTTNYYTYMASHTNSDLCQRGKNKASKHHLRQIGLALLVARNSRLPLFYATYPGNRHDSREFEQLMDEMFGVICGFEKTKERITVIIDKGMNSEQNFGWIDEHPRVHFITTYSPYFAEDLARTPLSQFEPVATAKNELLMANDQGHDRLLAFRTKGVFWGKERSVVVTYNPRTARKKNHVLESKLQQVRQELLEMRAKVRDNKPHWRNAAAIRERHVRLCERLHLAADLFSLEFAEDDSGLTMSFRKNHQRIARQKAMFGKSIIITDNTDWTTPDIVEGNFDRWQVEDRFRLSKDDDLVGTQPVRHWTDSKIRCHLFTCVVAMTQLRRLELRLLAAGIKRTAEDVMTDMRRLHSVLTLVPGRRMPERHIEQPTKTQSEVLSAFNHRVDRSGVLQPATR